MNETSSTLVAHCGASKVSREELMQIPVPEGTRTHQPLSHYEIVEVLEEALSFRYLKIVRDEYAVSQDGMKMFGVMDLNAEFDGGRFSIGLRNSNDKSMRLALTAGLRVFVCDNMAFSGDFSPLLHKHTRNLELRDSISIAVDRIHRGFEPLKEKIALMREQTLSDEEVKLIIYQAFLDRKIKGVPRHLMPIVHDNYFHPQQEAFIPRNLWSLSNAFTSGFKKLAPVKQFEVTARLGNYLSDVQESFIKRQELPVNLLKIGKTDRIEDEIAGNGFETGGDLIENPPDSGKNFQFPSPPNNFGYFACGKNDIREDRYSGEEYFDEDDIAEDPYDDEIFDEYFDQEEARGEIDEATEQVIEEYERRLAA